jgi:hypothetical protein
MRNFISTPNISLKRKLSTAFTIYNIDEYNTSAVSCNNNEEKCKNLILANKELVRKELHAVLTYKMENGRYGCINRDRNSVTNMRTITKYFLEYKKRPKEFSRIKNIKKVEPVKKRMRVTSKLWPKKSTTCANQYKRNTEEQLKLEEKGNLDKNKQK